MIPCSLHSQDPAKKASKVKALDKKKVVPKTPPKKRAAKAKEDKKSPKKVKRTAKAPPTEEDEQDEEDTDAEEEPKAERKIAMPGSQIIDVSSKKPNLLRDKFNLGNKYVH